MNGNVDYGITLMDKGTSLDTDKFFYGFRLDNLTVLDDGLYSAKETMPLEGRWHTLALFFTKPHLDKIMLVAPPKIAELLENELICDPSTPRTINFDGEVIFGVRAKTGELEGADNNRSLPFIVQEITS